MSKYQPLGDFLAHLKADQWRPTFHELERLLGAKLPPSARKHEAWWGNETGGPNSHARAWIDAGWATAKVDLAKEQVSFFKRTASPAAGAEADAGGAAEAVRAKARAAREWAQRQPRQAAMLVTDKPALVISAAAALAFGGGIVLGLLIGKPAASAGARVAEAAQDRAHDTFARLLAQFRQPAGGAAAAAETAQARAQESFNRLLARLRDLVEAAEAKIGR